MALIFLITQGPWTTVTETFVHATIVLLTIVTYLEVLNIVKLQT